MCDSGVGEGWVSLHGHTEQRLHMGTVAIQLKRAPIDTVGGVGDAGYCPQLCVYVSITICQRTGLTNSAPSRTSHSAKSLFLACDS